MNNFINVVVIVEGQTEEIFIKNILGKYLARKNIYITPIKISKPGQKGGDVKFARALNDISLHLKQRTDTYVTLFVDYYGIKNDWPGLAEAKKRTNPADIADVINRATHSEVNSKLNSCRSDIRFIPNIAIHEFETLLFSDPEILASHLDIKQSEIEKILNKFGEPERINNSPQTAPSKRLEKLYERYKKTNTGINIARAIGLSKMREMCPLFDDWLTNLENLQDVKRR